MRRRSARGQALAEFLALAVALVPLFLLMPMIAKYQDIAHASEMASRYVAFDATVRNGETGTWKAEAQLADEARRRFFSNADAPIKTNDTAGNFKSHQNLFWRGPTDEPLISDFGDVLVRFGQGNGATHAEGFTPLSDHGLSHLGEAMGLHSRGIYTAGVSVKLANLLAGLKSYEPFDSLDLGMTRRTSLLIDTWVSRSPDQSESRSGNAAIFPVQKLRQIGALVNADVSIIEALGNISGPKLGRLDFWRDVVPEDRLR